MIEPDGKVLVFIETDNMHFHLKEVQPSPTEEFKYLWLHVADHNYGAVLYPSKEDLIQLRDGLIEIIDSLPDGIGENDDDEEIDDEDWNTDNDPDPDPDDA
jgi:hypothetical protein